MSSSSLVTCEDVEDQRVQSAVVFILNSMDNMFNNNIFLLGICDKNSIAMRLLEGQDMIHLAR